ncbi:MAG: protein kinase, partial [Acidobacteriota bacterium]
RLVEGAGSGVSAERRAEVLLNASRHVEAASIFEELEKYDAAAMAYEAAGDIPHAAALWERSGATARAAELYARAERHYDAARCYATADEHLLAAEHFALADAHRNAGDAYLSADRPLEAASSYLEAGESESAKVALADIAEDHPSYAEASLILVPLMLDEGLVEEAGQRYISITEAVKHGRFLERSFEILYCKARYLEAKGRFEAAGNFYRKVMAQNINYRDASQRYEDIRDLLTADPSLAAPAEELTGVTRTLEAETHFTQPIRLKPSAASTGTQRPDQQPAARAAAASNVDAGSGTGTVELPVVIGDRLDPWWDGADFLSVTDRATDEPRLMVSFPLAVVGARASIFEQITRQLRSLRHRAVLQLEGTEVASDKVLLFYEAFDGETLEMALAGGREFAPRDALRLVIQLCEALTRAHKLGLTHQWLSPRTVLINRENRCKMVGLGLREFLAGDNPTSRAYLSPEVEEGTVVGPTSDVYSLGWLAMTLLEAQIPGRQERYEPTDVRWPAEVEKEIPSSLRLFLVRCLDKDPLARPSTAEMAA